MASLPIILLLVAILLTSHARGVFAAHPSAQAGYDYVVGFKDLLGADLDIQVSTPLKQSKNSRSRSPKDMGGGSKGILVLLPLWAGAMPEPSN